MRTEREIQEAITRVLEATTNDFVYLTGLAGLDPSTAFQDVDLSGMDFSGLDLAGFSFSGARLKDCNFKGAFIANATFSNDFGNLKWLRGAADWERYVEKKKRNLTPTPTLNRKKDGEFDKVQGHQRQSKPLERANYPGQGLPFHLLFAWHSQNGTRPNGSRQKKGFRRWAHKEFANCIGKTDTRSVRAWRRGEYPPSDLIAIERAFFGQNRDFDHWRLDLREAFKKANRRGKASRQRLVIESPYPGLRVAHQRRAAPPGLDVGRWLIAPEKLLEAVLRLRPISSVK
jgi:Pentapeptide repeats (8 copies)